MPVVTRAMARLLEATHEDEEDGEQLVVGRRGRIRNMKCKTSVKSNTDLKDPPKSSTPVRLESSFPKFQLDTTDEMSTTVESENSSDESDEQNYNITEYQELQYYEDDSTYRLKKNIPTWAGDAVAISMSLAVQAVFPSRPFSTTIYPPTKSGVSGGVLFAFENRKSATTSMM